MTTRKQQSELNAAVEECDRTQYEINVLNLQMKTVRLGLVKIKRHVNNAVYADFTARYRRNARRRQSPQPPAPGKHKEARTNRQS
jgi:hypothetical protein